MGMILLQTIWDIQNRKMVTDCDGNFWNDSIVRLLLYMNTSDSSKVQSMIPFFLKNKIPAFSFAIPKWLTILLVFK
jgi:hypothetical protein